MTNDCACVWVDGDDYDLPEFHSALMRAAAREHACTECGRTISRGERYESVKGKWNGKFSTYKTCVDCLSLRNEYFCGGFGYGDIWEQFGEHLNYCRGHISAESIANLTPAARESVCDMIEEMWGEDDDD